jgi:hypothetical protein
MAGKENNISDIKSIIRDKLFSNEDVLRKYEELSGRYRETSDAAERAILEAEIDKLLGIPPRNEQPEQSSKKRRSRSAF